MILIPQNDQKNFGYFLEYKVYEGLNSLGIFDDILLEENLKKKWGWEAAGIDHLLVLGDYVIPIQTKWRCTRRRENLCIHNYLKSLEYVLQLCGKKMLFGLWVSRLEPFQDNKDRLSSKGIHAVSCFESIDVLVQKTVDCVLKCIDAT
jgi:hypothetical protein